MKIIIVDDDKLVSLSLKTILETDPEIEVLATGSNGNEAITLYEKHHPDILLMDIRMEEMDGLSAAKEILSKYPEAKILLLTTFSDDEYIVNAISLGAKGYLLKQDFDSIAPALKAVMSGQTVFGGEILPKLPGLMTASDAPLPSASPAKDYDRFQAFGISDKEFEIIQLVAKGLNNKEIASSLYLGEGTVRNYLSTILEKLSLRDRTQLACYYYAGTVGEA
ncbi:MAG: response regulator transcription factor [Lachnospiraceae bacterium]|nr:response regulator transcription factor [Lachnospiraceae bacterium]